MWHCFCTFQADVCAACGIPENDVNRMLKPYQLVGVNFMLLLRRKNVGGGKSTGLSLLVGKTSRFLLRLCLYLYILEKFSLLTCCPYILSQ